MSSIDGNRLPAHVAIIMDGNGRWAKKRFLPRTAGHKAGAENLRKIAGECEKLGVKYLTVYAFSTENWSRPKDEVEYLMGLLRSYIQQYIDDKDKNDMRLLVIGRRDMLDEALLDKIDYIEDYTKEKQGLTMVIALNYGGRDEIIRAAAEVAQQVQKGAVSPENIDEKLFSRYLDTHEIPDPDLLIRTSGELRLSNFLLWQTAYTELYFTEKLWPDFDGMELKKAISDYQGRDRRFGGS